RAESLWRHSQFSRRLPEVFLPRGRGNQQRMFGDKEPMQAVRRSLELYSGKHVQAPLQYIQDNRAAKLGGSAAVKERKQKTDHSPPIERGTDQEKTEQLGVVLLLLRSRYEDLIPERSVFFPVADDVSAPIYTMARGKKSATIGELQFYVAIRAMRKQTDDPRYQVTRTPVEQKFHHTCPALGRLSPVCIWGAVKKRADDIPPQWLRTFPKRECNRQSTPLRSTCTPGLPGSQLLVGAGYPLTRICNGCIVLPKQVQSTINRPLGGGREGRLRFEA